MYKKIETDFSKLFPKEVLLTIYKVNEPNLLEKLKAFDGIIISGSNRRIHTDRSRHQLPRELLDLGIPVLGICYGFQWMTHVLGGVVATFPEKKEKKYNKFFEIKEPFMLSRHKYKFNHHDYIATIPPGFTEVLSHGEEIWMAYDKITGHIGVQFHPEKQLATGREFFMKWLIKIDKQ
jgi:GMP synthase (glutamine-hydrolysing)